jgi:predicted MFS family arabinose efflux permease
LLILLGYVAPDAPARSGAGMAAMIREGLAHAFASREIRRIMLRGFTFCASGAAVWALMPLVADEMLGRGPSVFGLLLGALGLGAVLSAASATRIRRGLSAEAITRVSGVVFGCAMLAIASAPGLGVILALLVVAGAGWVQAVSGFAVAGQMWSPPALVGRVTALVSSLIFGGIGVGSWLWGHVAEDFGVAFALGLSGGVMLVLPLLGLALPMPGHGGRAD